MHKGNQKMKKALLTSAALVLIPGISLASESLSDVPEAVLAAAQAAAPGAEITGVSMSDDDGTEVYEFSAALDGAELEIDVFADGTLDEVETVIMAEDLPDAVAAAISAVDGLEVTEYERSVRADGSVVYELSGMLNGGEVDVDVSSDGSAVEITED